MRRISCPSPAMVVAVAALFVALSGTAWAVGNAIVPLASRALNADNAKKLGGKTAAQVAAMPGPAATLGGKTADQIAAIPGPASAVASLVSIKSVSWSLNPGQEGPFTAACNAGQKATGGGFDNPTGSALAFESKPGTDGASWSVYELNVSSSAPASGSVYVVCAT
jgi:hypothetical protein